VAFIVWRAPTTCQAHAGAGSTSTPGTYFAFMREVLVFLIAVVDRIAFARMDPAIRAAFTTALVQHCADTLAGNETDLLGPADGVVSDSHRPGQRSDTALWRVRGRPEADPQRLCARLRFLRYLGSRRSRRCRRRPALGVDQVMASEARRGRDRPGAMLICCRAAQGPRAEGD
jgi:hypothetical protein